LNISSIDIVFTAVMNLTSARGQENTGTPRRTPLLKTETLILIPRKYNENAAFIECVCAHNSIHEQCPAEKPHRCILPVVYDFIPSQKIYRVALKHINIYVSNNIRTYNVILIQYITHQVL